MSTGRATALGIVALLHVFFLYALISGLAMKAVKVITGPMEVKNIEEQKKPDEPPPPPPPDLQDIPPYVPPPDVQVETTAPPPPITIQTTVPLPPPPPPVIHTAPPAPPPPSGPTNPATPKGKLGATITTDDYPDASIRAEEQGVTAVSYEINEQGRVTAGSCKVTSSSGSQRLDARTCELVERRFRFNPAMQNGTAVKSNRAQSVRWQIPKN